MLGAWLCEFKWKSGCESLSIQIFSRVISSIELRYCLSQTGAKINHFRLWLWTNYISSCSEKLAVIGVSRTNVETPVSPSCTPSAAPGFWNECSLAAEAYPKVSYHVAIPNFSYCRVCCMPELSNIYKSSNPDRYCESWWSLLRRFFRYEI